jgi:roadblock/LC7 domain-containing protein
MTDRFGLTGGALLAGGFVPDGEALAAEAEFPDEAGEMVEAAETAGGTAG